MALPDNVAAAVRDITIRGVSPTVHSPRSITHRATLDDVTDVLSSLKPHLSWANQRAIERLVMLVRDMTEDLECVD